MLVIVAVWQRIHNTSASLFGIIGNKKMCFLLSPVDMVQLYRFIVINCFDFLFIVPTR